MFAVGESPEVRVLVVDDQEPFRRAMCAVVEETDGFVVVGSATSGEDSLDAVATLRPDLVLMDVNLPGVDGLEATRRITAEQGGPVVVLLSTYDEDEFDASATGAAAYIAKAAFGPDRLSEIWYAAREGFDQAGDPDGDAQEQLALRRGE